MSAMVQDLREPIERLDSIIADHEERLLGSTGAVLDIRTLGSTLPLQQSDSY